MKRHVFMIACLISIFIMHAAVVFANQSHSHKKKRHQSKNQKKTVFVSIMPQKYFVERIAQDRLEVKVLVKPGASPATYEPKPKQMRDMAHAKLYFAVGVPFENSWLPKIAKSNPRMKIIHTDHGIEKLPMLAHVHHDEEDEDHNSSHKKSSHARKRHHSNKTSLKKETIFKIGNDGHIDAKIQAADEYHDEMDEDDEEQQHHHGHDVHSGHGDHDDHSKHGHKERSHKKKHKKHKMEEKKADEGHGIRDPHTWLSPSLVILQSRHILRALQEMDPSHYDFYENNYRLFISEILQLDAELRDIFKRSHGLQFMVFHPAWGYFADTYGLKQIPIEVEGKHPKPSQLRKLIRYAQRENIRVIFVQPQFSSKSAEQVAKEIDGRVIFIDPIALDWMQSLRDVAQDLSTALQ